MDLNKHFLIRNTRYYKIKLIINPTIAQSIAEAANNAIFVLCFSWY